MPVIKIHFIDSRSMHLLAWRKVGRFGLPTRRDEGDSEELIQGSKNVRFNGCASRTCVEIEYQENASISPGSWQALVLIVDEC